ncbi:DsbE family thiol:disulfide interchange protein [Methylibium sp.]|uniref:DsbE family thiol:disulfide interchange protein n=1 Tax=Methylibium sp. TaxID=2067992 RepID=UPI003D146507
MMKSLRFIVPLGLFAVLVFFLWRGLGLAPHELPSPLIGKPAPGFALARLDDANQTIRRDDMLGRVWMLNVWASWCVACREEHPTLMAFSQARLVPVIGLNYKDTRPAGLDWLGRFGNPYEASAFDAEGRVGIDFGVYGVPETFVIDKQGLVRLKHIGPLTPEVIQTRIQPLLKELNG